DRLRSSNRLLTAMESYARDLKAAHEAWKQAIARKRPDSDSSHIASEAMELAIDDLQARLHSASPKAGAELIPIDALMSHARRHLRGRAPRGPAPAAVVRPPGAAAPRRPHRRIPFPPSPGPAGAW